MRECPSSLLVVYMSAPSVSIIVAKVCRGVGKETFLVIPHYSSHFLICAFRFGAHTSLSNTSSRVRSGNQLTASFDSE